MSQSHRWIRLLPLAVERRRLGQRDEVVDAGVVEPQGPTDRS